MYQTFQLTKGNLPSGNLAIDVLTPKDKEDLNLIAKLNPEFIAASFSNHQKNAKQKLEKRMTF
jgi:pyruvate kinase